MVSGQTETSTGSVSGGELPRLLAGSIHTPESEHTAEGDGNCEIREIYGKKRWSCGRKVGSKEVKTIGRMGRERAFCISWNYPPLPENAGICETEGLCWYFSFHALKSERFMCLQAVKGSEGTQLKTTFQTFSDGSITSCVPISICTGPYVPSCLCL